jgi:hypothetical protein
LEALQNPEDERVKDMLLWLGDGYDPGAFSIDDVNRALRPRRRKK